MPNLYSFYTSFNTRDVFLRWLFIQNVTWNAHFMAFCAKRGDNTPFTMGFFYGFIYPVAWNAHFYGVLREAEVVIRLHDGFSLRTVTWTRIFRAFRTTEVIIRPSDGFSLQRVTWNEHFYGVLCTKRMRWYACMMAFIRRTRRAASNRPCPRARNDEARAMVSWSKLQLVLNWLFLH